MKRSIITFIFSVIIGLAGFSQITGTKYIGDGLDFQTVKDAISALNTYGTGEGGVTFMVPAGWTETFVYPTDGKITTTTGSSLSQIFFKKDPATTGPNPVITSGTGTGSFDAIITIAGCDWVTFDGINLKENPANLTNATKSAEWGYAILKASATDGSQNITIKNCSVRLDTNYQATIGIYSNNHLPDGVAQLVVTAVTGANSNLKIYSDSITSYTSISLTGYADLVAPFSYYDQNNEIGKDGQNVITKVAGLDGYAGYGIYGRCQNNLKVANNKVTSVMAGNGAPYGIYLFHAKNASYDVYNNYVSIQYSGGGTPSTTIFSPIYCTMGREGTTNTVNFYNNTVTGCTNTKMGSGTINYVMIDTIPVNAYIYGNTITNNQAGSSAVTATGTIYYLYSRRPSTTINGAWEIHDNMISGNTRTQSVSGGGNTFFIASNGNSITVKMYNNTVYNNIIASSGQAYGIYSYGTSAKDIYNNTISKLSKADGTTYGIYNYIFTGGTSNVYKNLVTNIEGNTAGVSINGIWTITTGSIYYGYNNMVSDLRATAATSTNAIVGINCSQVNPGFAGFYDNSVYLNATSSSATNFGTTAFLNGSSSNIIDLRNNIFVNTSTPKGTGKTVAVRFSSSTLTYFQPASNNNNLYVGPGASNLIFYDGTTAQQTLAAYKALVSPRESQSVSEMPPFTNITPGAMNLKLSTAIATQCESAGTIISTPIAVTTDFEGDARYPNPGYPTNGTNNPNAPDIGADEFGGIPNDQTGPAIIVTPLTNINHTNNRYMTVTILDGTGIPSSGPGLPRLYWKTQSTAYQSVQAIYVSPGTYSFYFGGGVNLGDVISYYVVAQDLWSTPNVTANPSAGVTVLTYNPPACSPAPTNPYTYTVMSNISGVFHVGVGKDYATLTAAAADINSKWIFAPVTLYLDDNTYPSETYPVTFYNNAGSSATNTLTIKPYTGATPTFATSSGGSGATGLIKLSGIDYMTIDGTALGNTGTRDLTIRNTYAPAPPTLPIQQYGIYFQNNGTDAPTNNTIKNCIIGCTLPTPANMPNMAITIYPVFFNNTGGPYDNTTFDNNFIRGGMFGVYAYLSTYQTTNLQVINNQIGSMTDADNIAATGVYTQNITNLLVSNNEMIGMASGGSMRSQTGVYIGANMIGSKITHNKIHDYYNNYDDTYSTAYGIWYQSSDVSAVSEISDNVIYNIKGFGYNPGVGQGEVYGIFMRNGGNLKIVHNSINLTGAFISGTDESSSGCLGFYYQATGGNIEVRNNILRNGMTNTNGSPVYGKAYGFMFSNPLSNFSVINNNDYWIDGYNGQIAQYYVNGTGAQTNFPTLASWQTFTGMEANSFNVDPIFTSDTYLLPTTGAMPHGGYYLSYVPTDILWATRTNPPDIGAYEFTVTPSLITTTGVSGLTNTSVTLEGSVSSAGENMNLFFDWGLTTAYGNTEAATPSSVPSHTITTMSVVLNTLTPGTTYHFRARGVNDPSGLIVYGSDMTFTTTVAAKTLNLKVLLEGLYAGSSVMNQAQDENGNHFGAGIADQVTVELHNASNYPTIEYSSGLVDLSTTGNVSITNLPVSLTGSYYITIKHRNSIETTTFFPVSFAGNTVSYDFTTAAPQAYGNNQKDVGGGRYVFWTGDVTQDGIVDSGDLNAVDNASTAIMMGYNPEDVNGDGLVDSGDMNYVDNNSTAIIMAQLP